MEISNWERVKHQTWEFNTILMGHAVSRFGDLNSLHQTKNEKEAVRLHFGLSGDYRFSFSQLKQSFDLIGGHHNIMYSKGIDIEIANKSIEIETFGIAFPKELFVEFTQDGDDLLKKFSEDILSGKEVIISKEWGTVTAKIQCAIDEIILNPYQGSLQNIFLLAKSLELLVLCVDNYKHVGDRNYVWLKSNEDKERVIAARDFINSRIEKPPNLSEIARAVGINEFKLKNGFKEMFHSTVFGYLTEKRLNMAKQLLLDTRKPLTEIAYELGYSSPQHFNNQFRKRFGNTPNSVRKNS